MEHGTYNSLNGTNKETIYSAWVSILGSENKYKI